MKFFFSMSLIFTLMFYPVNSQCTSEPSYAKWGKIAMEQTQKKYNVPIIDYLHMGRENINNQISAEKFKLWLKSADREFGVVVTIKFFVANEEIISIDFHETDR